MKLIKLSVEKLYGHYSYDDIVFNQDVTFLYGMNGCGKTTILNITEAIITGQIFKLFNYEFDNIKLQYAPQKNIQNIKEILIKCIETDKLIINFDNNICEIENNSKDISDARVNDRNPIEKYRYFFRKYPMLINIKDLFNYVYLPLNRSSVIQDIENEDDYYMIRHMRNRRNGIYDIISEPDNKDLAMLRIENLIFDSCNRINKEVSDISDQFRNDILKSLLDLGNQSSDPTEILMQFIEQKKDISTIKQTKRAYINILKEFSLITQEEEDHYTYFFNNLVDSMNKAKNEDVVLPSLFKFNEIIRLKKLISLAERTEQKKSNVRKPIENFLSTMNEFINNSEEEKEIKIDAFGRVYFTTKYNKEPISIQYLSSGEKQLITFFSNLIFKVNNNMAGIFVVDEPELSLHLLWQRIFVEKTLEINKNIQLIFATHSPEIIGKNRRKMFRLEKKYID